MLSLLLLMLCTYFVHAAPSTASKDTLAIRSTTLPSKDAFYSAPQNLSDYAPGDIIRYREPPNPLTFYNGRANLAGAWQLLYRTNGVNGEPLATVTTVMVPHNADFGKLLSYQVEIDAPYDGCFPSYALQQGGAYVDNISAQYGELWYISALARGWVVASPDHEGPNAAFASGVIGGHATLDNLRAVLQSQHITGVLPNAKLAIWGYSGGAQATEFALELQKDYAPELNIMAAALGGTPADFRTALAKINGGIGAGVGVGAILGLTRAYPALKALVDESLFPDNSSAYAQAEKQCIVSTVVEFAFQDIFTYVKGGQAVLSQPAAIATLDDNLMGKRSVPTVPIYLYHAINDELLPVETIESLYDSYCAAGANIQFTKEAFGEHIIVAITGAAGALQFLIDRMDGKPFAKGCSSRTVLSSALDPSSIGVLGEFVYNDLLALLGAPIGPMQWLKQAGKHYV